MIIVDIRVKQAPQVAEIPVPLQPAEPINITPNVQENVLQTAKDSEAELWWFDRAINEVFRLLPQAPCIIESGTWYHFSR